MSHLGHRLSALIDGELSAADRDRVHAHLAGCAACRAEANELRELKKTMRGLADMPPGEALTRRLIAIAEPGDPVPPRRRARRMTPRSRPGFRTVPRPARAHGQQSAAAGARRPGGRRHRGRYVALGVASCVVAGLGVTAFTMGGSQPLPGPRITPPVQMYSIEHAITTGEVPFGGSSVVPAPEITGSSQEP